MKLSNYDEFVVTRKKNPDHIVGEFNAAKADLLHMAVGISKESGELLDSIARLCFYDKELDLENVVEEMGDIEFFLSGLRDRVGIMLGVSTVDLQEKILRHNVGKLSARYSSGKFSNDQANARADKANEGGEYIGEF